MWYPLYRMSTQIKVPHLTRTPHGKVTKSWLLPVGSRTVLPGLSDHDIVLAEVNIKPKITKHVPRDISLYQKADWDQLKQSMRDFHKVVLSDLTTETFRFCGTSSSLNSSKTFTHLFRLVRPDHEMVSPG